MVNPDKSFWSERYDSGMMGWDIGEVSSPLKAYFDQLDNKKIKILIPGGGNSYEAEYLHNQGFQNVFVVDIAEQPLENFKNRVPAFPEGNLIRADFFELDIKADFTIEQTFFCALHPSLRAKYAQKMHNILSANGQLVGVLFDDLLNDDKPPFGGTPEEYAGYFEPYFHFKVFERCYNSIPERSNREVFVNLVKKQ